MGALKKMFSGKDARLQREAQARAEELQRQNISDQQAAQRKQLEVQQSERASNEAQLAARRERRGSRLLLAASTGFRGVSDSSSKLG